MASQNTLQQATSGVIGALKQKMGKLNTENDVLKDTIERLTRELADKDQHCSTVGIRFLILFLSRLVFQ